MPCSHTMRMSWRPPRASDERKPAMLPAANIRMRKSSRRNMGSGTRRSTAMNTPRRASPPAISPITVESHGRSFQSSCVREQRLAEPGFIFAGRESQQPPHIPSDVLGRGRGHDPEHLCTGCLLDLFRLVEELLVELLAGTKPHDLDRLTVRVAPGKSHEVVGQVHYPNWLAHVEDQEVTPRAKRCGVEDQPGRLWDGHEEARHIRQR